MGEKDEKTARRLAEFRAKLLALCKTAQIDGGLQLNGGIGTGVKRANTGRTTPSFTPEQQRDERLANSWKLHPASRLADHPVSALIASAIAGAACTTGDFRGFRGVILPVDIELTEAHFGPPPTVHQNRYNNANQRVLYLASDLAGVRAELMGRAVALDKAAFIRRYEIPSSAAKIADLGNPDLRALVHFGFEITEMSPDSVGYERSQFMADLVRMAGFDGMLVPGVRGNPKNHYSNLVLFEPEPKWRDWITGDLPQQINLNAS